MKLRKFLLVLYIKNEAKADIVHHRNKGTSNALQGGCVTLGPCHLHFKSILKQKKNYGNSNIFHHAKI